MKQNMHNHNLNPASSLKRELSVLNAWALAFGCVIGWSAFVMPGTLFLPNAGPVGTMFAIQIAAFTMLIISYNYTYMIGKFPIAGGEFVYASRAFGKLHGFICSWFLALSYLCVIPLNATAFNLILRILFGDFFSFGYMYSFSGYDIYAGDMIVVAFMLISFAFISFLGARVTGVLQTVMVFILLGGLAVITASAVFLSLYQGTFSLNPMFSPTGDSNHFVQIMAVLVTAPMSYVGFDIVPQLTEETKFPTERVKVIMDASILMGLLVYIVLAFLACAYVPTGYSNWSEYLADLGNLSGVRSLPTLNVSYQVLGRTGIFIMACSIFTAMFTGIVGFYMATSRLLYAMAREGILPYWFAYVNQRHMPVNSVVFCFIASCVACLLGRAVLGMIFDMASIGAAIGFAYTSLAAYKFATHEKKTDVRVWGILGFLFSLAFAFLLLVPLPGLNVSLSFNSYVALMVWLTLGIIFYNLSVRENQKFGVFVS